MVAPLDVWWTTDPSLRVLYTRLFLSMQLSSHRPRAVGGLWDFECNVESGVWERPCPPHTVALHHSNGAARRASRLTLFTIVLRPLQVVGHFFFRSVIQRRPWETLAGANLYDKQREVFEGFHKIRPCEEEYIGDPSESSK